MIKKDISKILAGGSLKQRIALLAEDRARRTFEFAHPDLQDRDTLLTDKERDTILDSFKTPQEIRMYNNWREYDRDVVTALNNLQSLSFEVRMHHSNLRGYILTWYSMENAELLVNIVLHEIKDPEERIRIAKQGESDTGFLFSDVTVDKEGYIAINTQERLQVTDTARLSFVDIINNVKKQATDTAIRFISLRQAILDYMEDKGFNVKTYKDMVKLLSEQVYTPIIGWGKYESRELYFMPDIPNPRVDKLKALYSVCPNIEELEVDKDIYENYKAKTLGDE